MEILETVRDKVPAEVFTTPYSNPVGGNPEAVRNNQREALRLLRQAGYEVRDRRLVNVKTGAADAGRDSSDKTKAISASRCSTSPAWSGSASR